MHIIKEFEKNEENNTITYDRYNVNEFDLELLEKAINSNYSSYQAKHRHSVVDKDSIQDKIQYIQTKKGKYSESVCVNVHCGFDIETTRTTDIENNPVTFMYGWQFSINNTVIWGTYFDELINFLDFLKINMQYHKAHKLLVFVANLGYEWQFIRHYLKVTESFFKEVREPVKIVHDDFIIFHEALSWGGSLEKIANDYTNLIKLKGDLDYSIYRESYNDFDNVDEWYYIDFDVLILSQFHEWYCAQYLLTEHYTPVTIQSALRHNMINRGAAKGCCKFYMPKTYEFYSIIMNWVYRGGYTHGNIKLFDRLLNSLNYIMWSYDFTSSYPSVMLVEKYPKRFRKIKKGIYNSVIKDVLSDVDNLAFIGLFRFRNICATTSHTIESITKLLDYDKSTTIADNGRLLKSDSVLVWLTEQDILTYKEFYTWDSVECLELYKADKDYLPRYLLDEMAESYTVKALNKKVHKPYAIEKAYCNSLYGCTVTRMIINDIKLDDDNIPYKDNKDVNNAYEKEKEKSILSPFWGVYVSAYARRNLLKVLGQLEKTGNTCIYCDTDSIKFYDINNGLDIINTYNQVQIEKVKARVKALNYNESVFLDYENHYKECIGTFDCEYEKGIKTFKFLGAKRYLHTYFKYNKDINDYELKYSCTVAGLPKSAYIKAFKPKDNDNELDFFNPFKDDLVMKDCKNGSSYSEDGKTHYYRDKKGKLQVLKSFVNIQPIDFTMTISEAYLLLINKMQSVTECRNYG